MHTQDTHTHSHSFTELSRPGHGGTRLGEQKGSMGGLGEGLEWARGGGGVCS